MDELELIERDKKNESVLLNYYRGDTYSGYESKSRNLRKLLNFLPAAITFDFGDRFTHVGNPRHASFDDLFTFGAAPSGIEHGWQVDHYGYVNCISIISAHT